MWSQEMHLKCMLRPGVIGNVSQLIMWSDHWKHILIPDVNKAEILAKKEVILSLLTQVLTVILVDLEDKNGRTGENAVLNVTDL